MPASIGCLPFDLLYNIAILLDIRSYLELSRSNKHLYRLLQDENTARQCLERNEWFNQYIATILSKERPGSPRNVLSLLLDQRDAIGTASPYSASTIAYGTQFLFCQGTLCYICDEQIRILDIFNRSHTERVISGSVLRSRLTINLDLPDQPDDHFENVTLLGYADNILILLCEEASGPTSWLFALDTKNDDASRPTIGPSLRLRLRRRLVSKTKIFVRHNKDYLYFGTHSASREDGHHEWQVQGCNLTTGRNVSPKSLRLTDFVGSEIGSTACFEIHDGHFYALSNQTSFDTEEVDWTSSYHYICFKLDEASPDLKLHKIWRRQHHEGPINDAWTELSMKPNKQHNELKIAEVRREWLGGGTRCHRTAYTSSFRDTTDEEISLGQPSFPVDDQLSRTLDECSRPEYTPNPPIRISKHCHHEYVAEQTQDNEFIRAKTKHHSYIGSAHSFLDLVADELRVPGSVRPRDRIRLRIASRLPASSLITDHTNPDHFRIRPKILDQNDEEISDSEEAYTDTAIKLWPPLDAPTELYELLCPGGRAGNVHAVSDEQATVYVAGTPNPQHSNQRAIVMINFDPRWGHEGLKRLPGKKKLSARQSELVQPMIVEERQDIRNVHVTGRYLQRPDIRHTVGSDVGNLDIITRTPAEARRTPKRAFDAIQDGESAAGASKRQRVEESASTAEEGGPQRLTWTESAMYLDINHGFWLR